MSLLEVLATLTHKPAALLRQNMGTLQKGAPADLTIFDINKAWTIDNTKFHSKSHNSPFDGRQVKGVVLRTVIGGQTVYTLEP